MESIILYSNNCPQCKCLEKMLKEKNIDFKEVNDIDLMLEKGFKSMPMLQVGEAIMKYVEALQWVKK